MRTKSKNINTRVSEELYNAVDAVASEKRVSRSDVVRTILEKEFLENRSEVVASLSDEEREKFLRELGKMLGVMSEMRDANRALGNNVNQIARALNSGQQSVSEYDLKVYERFGKQFDANFENMAKVLDKLWRTLV